MSKIDWWYYLICGFTILYIAMGVATLIYGDSYWHGFSSWKDIVILVLFLCGVGLVETGVIMCHYQVLGKNTKGE